MSRKILALLLAVLLALCLSGACAESASVTVTDMYGREITLSQPAERIVALTPSDCEILCAHDEEAGPGVISGLKAGCARHSVSPKTYPIRKAGIPICAERP